MASIDYYIDSKCDNPLCTICNIEEDVVNHPKHYQLEIDGALIEVTKLIELVTTKEEYIGFLKGNILKYHIRAHAKNGIEDIKKANFYSRILERLI